MFGLQDRKTIVRHIDSARASGARLRTALTAAVCEMLSGIDDFAISNRGPKPSSTGCKVS